MGVERFRVSVQVEFGAQRDRISLNPLSKALNTRALPHTVQTCTVHRHIYSAFDADSPFFQPYFSCRAQQRWPHKRLKLASGIPGQTVYTRENVKHQIPLYPAIILCTHT